MSPTPSVPRRAALLGGAASVAAVPRPARAVPPPQSPPRSTPPDPARDGALAWNAPASAEPLVRLGGSPLFVPPLGVGAWAWGDRTGYWGFNQSYGEDDVATAYDATLAGGIPLVDTAEAYGFGKQRERDETFDTP